MKTSISSLPGYTLDKRPRFFEIRTCDGNLKRHFLINLIKYGSVTHVPLSLVGELYCKTHYMAPYQACHVYAAAIRQKDAFGMVPADYALCLIDKSSALAYIQRSRIPKPDKITESI